MQLSVGLNKALKNNFRSGIIYSLQEKIKQIKTSFWLSCGLHLFVFSSSMLMPMISIQHKIEQENNLLLDNIEIGTEDNLPEIQLGSREDIPQEISTSNLLDKIDKAMTEAANEITKPDVNEKDIADEILETLKKVKEEKVKKTEEVKGAQPQSALLKNLEKLENMILDDVKDAPKDKKKPITAKQINALIEQVNKHFRKCWKLPTGIRHSNYSNRNAVKVLIEMRNNATVSNVKVISGDTNGVIAESAQCAALHNSCRVAPFLLNYEYQLWKQIEITFDPSGMLDN